MKTQISLSSIYPLNKGLDKSSIPGTQDNKSLTKAKNVTLRSRPSIRKRPGLRRIDYIGDSTGIQAATHFFGTFGRSMIHEIVMVRNGNVEVIRDGLIVDLGYSVSPTDSVTFTRFVNLLIIHFENSPPVYHTPMGTSVSSLSILSSHLRTPPQFSRVFNFRLLYSGRPTDAHRVWASAINDPTSYSLASGGFSMRVYDGDGDPVGITGLSPIISNECYCTKWNNIYKLYVTSYGIGIDIVTDEAGCVHHNTISKVGSDCLFVGMDAIRSLRVTAEKGGAEEFTLTYPIYEWFQEAVNWSQYKTMIACYDKPLNSYLLSYTSSGSAVNDKILGMNASTKEFFEFEETEWPVIGKYFDYGRQKTMVGWEGHGICILDSKENTDLGIPIDSEIETGQIFPLGNPKALVTFTKAWIVTKPTVKTTNITFTYYIDSKLIESVTIDTLGGGEGSLINEDSGGFIGEEDIGYMYNDMIVTEVDLKGRGGAIKINIKHEPPDNDADQEFELYGLIYEYETNEDTDVTVKV